jgi:hypothetical protein
MTWPLPETDYEGNDIWALNFPKPQPMIPAEIEWERMRMNETPNDRAHRQAMNPYNYMGLFGATPEYLRWVGIVGQGY